MNFSLASILLSTIAYFVAAYYVRRYLEDIGVEKGMTRGLVVFTLALAVSYGVSAVVDWFESGRTHSVAATSAGAEQPRQ